MERKKFTRTWHKKNQWTRKKRQGKQRKEMKEGEKKEKRNVGKGKEIY